MLRPLTRPHSRLGDQVNEAYVHCLVQLHTKIEFAASDPKVRILRRTAAPLPADTLPSAAQAKQAASLQDVETELERLRVKAAAKVRPVGALPVASCLTRPSPAGPRVSVAALLRPAQAEDQYPGTRLQGPRLRVAQC